MKPRKNAFFYGSLALAAACTAQAAQIDVVGVVTGLGAAAIAPVNTTVGSGVRGVHAITTNQTWTKNNEYFLTDRVFVPKGITLTIEPGTKIYGSTNDNGTPANKADDKVGSLVAARGGRIIAEGTPEEPILFTAVAVWEAENNQDSIFDPGTAIGVPGNPNNGMPGPSDAGLWGGVVVLGNSYLLHLNGTTGTNGGIALIEGFVPGGTPDDNGNGLPDAAEYGFDASGEFARDDNDDSGVYRYITISHGGYEFDAGREINGLTLGAVGAGTIIDHIEVVANADDGIEFFGGTVSTSHIFLAYNQDDNFDFDSGYTGTMQFFFSIQNPGFADGGFEHDGIEGTTATQAAYDAAFTTVDTTNGNHVPKGGIILSKPRMYNGNVIGPGRNNTFSTIAANTGQVLTEKGNHGFIYDDYYNGEIYNSVIDDFSQKLAFFRDGAKSYGATAAAAHNTLGRFGVNSVTIGSPTTYITGTNVRSLFMNAIGQPTGNNSAVNTDPKLRVYTRNGSNFLTAIDPRPAADSPLLKSNGATLQPGAPMPVNYRGAFGPGDNANWAAGWTKTWKSGILQGGYTPGGEPPFADTDNDGIDDALEASPQLAALGFVVGNDDSALFASLYTETSILDLRTTAGVTVQKTNAPTNNVTLTVPVEKSTGLNTWEDAGIMTLGPFTGDPTKEFYRLEVKGAN